MGHSINTISCCAESFAAAPGWDAVSGLGSPNFGILSNLVINNASSFASIGAYPNGEISSDDDSSGEEVQSLAIAAIVIAIISLLITIYGLSKL